MPGAGGSRWITIFSGRTAIATAWPECSTSSGSSMVSGASRGGRLHAPEAVLLALHMALEDVHVADELGDEAGLGLLVDLARRRHLHDPAVVHDRDAVGHGHGLLLVVGDDHEGHAELVLDVHQLELGLLAQLLVEGAERLVEKQHLRLLGERAGERHALALAAGELARIAPGELLELDEAQHLADAGRDLGPSATRPA